MKIVMSLLASAVLIGAALPAEAGVCTREIEMVSKLLGGGGASVPSVGSAAPAVPSTSSSSTLGAVTGGGAAGALGSSAPSVGGAAPGASTEALESVELAREADAAGDEASCMDHIGKAKELLGLVQ
jgi:hypothetical protein